MEFLHFTGGTCNQFWIMSNYISESIENNEKFSIYLPDPAFKEFDGILKSNYVNLYFKNFYQKKIYKIIRKILTKPISIKTLNIFLFIFGMKIKSISLDKVAKSKHRIKHLSKIREFFYPNKNIVDNVTSLFNEYKKDVLIGVHIRRGDYEFHSNGNYFFSFEEYSIVLNKIKKQFEGKNVVFFIASNEEVDFTPFEGLNYFMNKHRSMAHDLFGLSQCNYIIGPVSTYSTWASIYNFIPMHHFEDVNEQLTLEKFKKMGKDWFSSNKL